jgi:hypothetical protein
LVAALADACHPSSMPEKEWTLPRGPFALQIRRQTVGGKVHSFAVILLAMHGGK